MDASYAPLALSPNGPLSPGVLDAPAPPTSGANSGGGTKPPGSKPPQGVKPLPGIVPPTSAATPQRAKPLDDANFATPNISRSNSPRTIIDSSNKPVSGALVVCFFYL